MKSERRWCLFTVLVITVAMPLARASVATGETLIGDPPDQFQIRPVFTLLPPVTAPTTVASPTTFDQDDPAVAAVASCDAQAIAMLPFVPTTPRADNRPTACVVLEARAATPLPQPRYYLGPVQLTSEDVKHAKARFVEGQGGRVDLTLTRAGLRKLNDMAAALFPQPPPANQAALVLNGEVLSAPAFQTTTFDDRAAIAISGGFSRAEARHLAKLINRS